MGGKVQEGRKQCRYDNDVGRVGERPTRSLRCCFLLGLGFSCLYFVSFLVLVSSVVREYTRFKFSINFLEICLDFVVFARMTQTNDSKVLLEAQLLIDLARSKACFVRPQLSSWFMSTSAIADFHQGRILWKQNKLWFKKMKEKTGWLPETFCDHSLITVNSHEP